MKLFRFDVAEGACIPFDTLHVDQVRLLHGWAFSYVILPPYIRQITAIHLPGDLIIAQRPLAACLDHGVACPNGAKIETVGLIDGGAVEVRREAHLQTWLCVTRRSAVQRVAHLVCELHFRLAEGSVAGDRFAWPLLQEHVADAVGLTSVHTNRMLRDLRERDLAQVGAGVAIIRNIGGLRALAHFDDGYLR